MLSIDLSKKTALVLGGSRGIGAAVTEMLASAGAAVYFTHTGNPKHAERIQTLVDKISTVGGEAFDAAMDALDSRSSEQLVERIVKEKGGLDILVCNVGKNVARLPEEISDEIWQELIDINLTSAFYGVRPALKPMTEAGYGKIILIGSSAVFDGGGGAIDYAAAKAGMIGMMTYLCRAYLRKGIRTNIIHPCVIETDLLKVRYNDPEKRKALESQIPVGRFGKPEDIAGLAAFLASEHGDYICGQEILCDGGRTMYNK